MLTAQGKLAFAMLDRNIEKAETTLRNQGHRAHPDVGDRLEHLYEVRAQYVEECGGYEPCKPCKGRGWVLIEKDGKDAEGTCSHCHGAGSVFKE